MLRVENVPNETDPAIYYSPEALSAYLESISRRIEARKCQLVTHITSGINLVDDACQRARIVMDTPLEAELNTVLNEFKRRLYILTETPPVGLTLGELPISGDNADTLSGSQTTNEINDPTSIATADTFSDALALEPEIVEQVVVSPLTPEERANLIGDVLTAISKIDGEWSEIDRTGLALDNGSLHRIRCFMVRSLACSLASIYKKAKEDGIADAIHSEVKCLSDHIEMARQYANDFSTELPLEYEYWSLNNELASDDWREIAERYRSLSTADEAWNKFEDMQSLLGEATRITLLNNIAAVQQRLYRCLEQYGFRDKLQNEFYIQIKEKAFGTGYLRALNAECRIEELDDYIARLPDSLSDAAREYSINSEREAKVARKTAAIQSVVKWLEGMDANNQLKDFEPLYTLLDECIAAGVPPTNVQIRGLLLHTTYQALIGFPRYAKILDAVMAERQRQGLDTDESGNDAAMDEEEQSESYLENYRQSVMPHMEGKRILILGGIPREHTCDELRDAIRCADVKWLASKKSDTAGKFQSDIKKSDILLLVKNFAGHDMSEKGREWIRQVNGHFILLPSGYGVAQIINQLHKYFVGNNGRA